MSSSETDSESESVEFNENTPPELRESATSAKVDLIPEKSKAEYWKEYNNFIEWKNEKKVKVISQNVMLAYFNMLSKKYSPSSLWKYRSILKSTLLIKNGVKLDDFHELTSLLKTLSKNHKVKKSKVLNPEEMKTFLNTAPDNNYLVTKVALVIGLYGACRHCELLNLTTDDVVDLNQFIKVSLKDTKNNKSRTFVIEGEYLKLIRSYIALRPISCTSNRFFLRYQDGKCYSQPIGKNKIGTMPSLIARFLNLPDYALYTGHAFRRSSATAAADSGMTMTDLKRLGGWASANVAEGYIEESILHKKKTSTQISNAIGVSQDDISVIIPELEAKRPRLDAGPQPTPGSSSMNISCLSSNSDRVALNISNSSNININIYNNK